MSDRTRYQVLVYARDARGVKGLDRNFTVRQRAAARAYFQKLKDAGYNPAWWDTRRNALSAIFSVAFR
jgi:hypothetical protein